MPEPRSLALETWDRVVASDPGLGRLRLALSVVVCVGTSLPLQLLLGSILGYRPDHLVSTTLFGAVVAMLAANALVSKSRARIVRTAAVFPLAIAVGLVPATTVSGSRALQVIGFAVVLFAAVWVRKFGSDWFFYGFMTWMAFFFATFLQATWTLLPELLLASTASTVWVSILSFALFHSQGRRVLRSTVRASYSHARAVARECVDLLDVRPDSERGRTRALRSLSRRRAALAEAGLLVDAWSGDQDALPQGWSAAALRRRMVETQQAVDRFAGAAIALEGASTEITLESRRALNHLARHRDTAAIAATDRLDRLADRARDDGDDSWWPARHLAFGVREFLRFDAADDPPVDETIDHPSFEPVSLLVRGDLPGSPSVGRGVPSRASRWNPASRLSMSTRQAWQVAIAGLISILVGTLLSPTHYYWAAIAVFVTFTGTGTRTETLLRGCARIGGTVVGIGAALVIAAATTGHTVAIVATILVAVFMAFYLAKVSFLASTFFVTILLGQLYTAIGTYSNGLLELRLGETAIGAVVGVSVAMLFAPLSTRDTVRAARDDLLVALEELLRGVAAHVAGERADLNELVRTLDDRARRINLVARPLTKPVVAGRSSRRTRRRLTLYAAAVTQARGLAVALQRRPAVHPEATVRAAAALADAIDVLLVTPMGASAPGARAPLRRSDVALFDDQESTRDKDPALRHLHRLNAMINELAEISVGAAL